MKNKKSYEMITEKIIDDFERLAYIIFTDPVRNEVLCKKRGYKKVCVELFCILSGSVTIDQLSSMYIFKNEHLRSLRRFMDINCNKDARKSGALFDKYENISVNGKRVISYEINALGRKDFSYMIDTWIQDGFLPYIDKKSINTFIENMQLPVKNEKNLHYIYAHDCAAGFIGLDWPSPFHIAYEVGVLKTGDFLDSYNRTYFDREYRKNIAFYSDSFIRWWSEEENSKCIQCFIEQDMHTQHLGIIVNKINNYITTIFSNGGVNIPGCTTLLFSVSPYLGTVSKQSNNRLRSKRDSFYPMDIMAKAIYGVKWKDTLLKDFMVHIYPLIENDLYYQCKYKKFYEILYNKYNEDPTITLGKLFNEELPNIASSLYKRQDEWENSKQKRSISYYLERRDSTFFNAIEKNKDELKQLFLSGFSIACIHNMRIQTMLPCIYPSLSNNYQKFINTIFKVHFNIEVGDNYQYSSMCDTGIITFKNHIKVNDTYSSYTENLSDDFGARHRFIKLLGSSYDGNPGFILFLLSDEDFSSEFINKLLKNSETDNMLINDGALSINNLNILFSKYSSFLNNDVMSVSQFKNGVLSHIDEVISLF